MPLIRRPKKPNKIYYIRTICEERTDIMAALSLHGTSRFRLSNSMKGKRAT
jgi:hypothetical protein